jgi:NADH dehydrogenase FAD-containing subunit
MNIFFEAVLDCTATRELFRKHLEAARTVESLDLIEAVEKFSLLKSDANRFKAALDIVHTFIGTTALHEVNISEEAKLLLQATLVLCSPKSCPRALFDRILHDIVLELKQDSFPRFLQSKSLCSYFKDQESTLGAEKYRDLIADLSAFDPLLYPQHEKLACLSCYIEEANDVVSAPSLDTFSNNDIDDTEMDDMIKAMKEPYSGIPVGDRKAGFRSYNKCFRASEIVTWLCSHLKVDRQEAIRSFNSIQKRRRLFLRIDKKSVDETFKDTEKRLYRFKARKHVVLVGGGFANVIAARKLEDTYDVTLIDPKPAFECIPSFPLLISDPTRIDKIRYNYHASLKSTRIVADHVTHVTSKRVYLSGLFGHEGAQSIVHKDEDIEQDEDLPYVEFDYLVIGTGHKKAERFKIEAGSNAGDSCAIIYPYEWKTIINNFNDIRCAKKIVVVGGGAMGVEVASEILHYYTDVLVTMIVSGPTLLHTFDKSVSEACASKLAKFKNLKILTDSEVTFVKGRTVQFRSIVEGYSLPRKVEADVVMVCTGTRPNSDMLSKYMPQALRSNDKAILVNKSFQVKRDDSNFYANIFAVGDVTAINEVKLANLAMHHGRVISEIINSIESGVAMNKLAHYKILIEPLAISFGPDSALLVVNGKAIANNMIVREIKYKLETKVDFVLMHSKKFLALV